METLGSDDRDGLAREPADLLHSTRVPHSSIRRRTAQHMVFSKSTAAHVYAALDVDFANIQRLRSDVRDEWKASEGFGLNYLPFVARAIVMAIGEFPELNSMFEERELIIHNEVRLGVAVDLDFKGLVVPVIRRAQEKTMRQIAREIQELGVAAKARKLTLDDMSGGTFTLTNPGPFGARMTLPIIHQPQVAILSTDSIALRPFVEESVDGPAVVVRPIGNLTLGWDHRAFDGAYASSALAKIRSLLESHDWSAEL